MDAGRAKKGGIECAHNEEALLDVVTDANALELPPHVTKDEVTQFAAAVTRSDLSGGLRNMFELARTSLRNTPRS